MLKEGLKAVVTDIVTNEKTAAIIGSGDLKVYATPALTALMEKAACAALKGRLADDETTVGIMISVEHTSATPVGMNVSCDACLVGIDRRKLTFEITAYDDKGVIGKARHERFIVNAKSFQDKADNK